MRLGFKRFFCDWSLPKFQIDIDTRIQKEKPNLTPGLLRRIGKHFTPKPEWLALMPLSLPFHQSDNIVTSNFQNIGARAGTLHARTEQKHCCVCRCEKNSTWNMWSSNPLILFVPFLELFSFHFLSFLFMCNVRPFSSCSGVSAGVILF